jgi:dephospho-CoA kinase
MNSNNIRVIAVTGMPGSGKSVFAEHAEELGYHIVVMGDVVRAKVVEEGFEPTPERSQKMMIKLREKMGEQAIAHLTCETIDKMIEEGKKNIIIDGIRSQAEVLHFQEHLGNDFVIVAIHVDPSLRYERLRIRGRKDAPTTEEDFKKRDISELKLGLGETIAFSNYVIPNNKTLDDFRILSLDLLNELEKSDNE